MKKSILNLDEPESICSALHSLLDAPGVWDILLADVRGTYNIFSELAQTEESIKTPVVRQLRKDAECHIRSEYTSVIAYHACRPLERSSYTSRGIIRTNETLLRELTHKTFGDSSDIEKAFNPVCKEYLNWYNGTIGLFLTAYEETSWYKCPKFLGDMMQALGNQSRHLLDDFLERAIPTIIKCRIPLDWVDTKMRDPSIGYYASSVLQRMILMRANSQYPTNDLGALGLKVDIPPELILEFLDPLRDE